MPVSWQIGRWPSAHMLRVGQDLRDRILGGRALLRLVGAGQAADVVRRVVVADVLQRGGDAFDQVGLADRRHGGSSSVMETLVDQCFTFAAFSPGNMMRSVAAIAIAENRNVIWIAVCAISTLSE